MTVVLSSEGLGNRCRVFSITSVGMGGGTGFQWVEFRDAAKHPPISRIAPNNKELSVHKCQ